jgi:acetyltransferase-like isoleucine patch superfamily enzyme
MTLRLAAKRTAQAVSLALVLPGALLCGFGRLQTLYLLFAQAYAGVPGLIGVFLRAAFYRLTLEDCSIDITISYGSFFVYPCARVGRMVSFGSYCVVGKASIGPRTQIASLVQIPSGRREHERDSEGRLGSSIDNGHTVIGADCWIGSSAVIMAEVGQGSTIGAGAIVVKPIPPGSVAVGNPARVIRQVPTALPGGG